MKKTILFGAIGAISLAAPAMGADLAARPYTKAPAVVTATVYDWSGFYIGVHGGGGWGRKDWLFDTALTRTSHDVSGGLGGFQGGYNFQTGAFVFGVEGEYSFTDIKGSSVCPDPTYTCYSKVRGIGDIAGRAGYAADRALFYVKGGGAWVNDRYDAVNTALPNTATGTETRGGWLVGAGIEYAVATNWTVKGEFDYMDFGTKTVSRTATNGLPAQNLDVTQRISIAKVGINYKFGGPVVARY